MTKRRDALKDFLEPINSAEFSTENSVLRQRPHIASGALQSMNEAISGLSQEAEQLRKALAEGSTIIEIDPDDIDNSFIRDRLDDYSGDEFESLVASIRENGQAIPVLVRPHPKNEGRYQLAFGHRRVAALRSLQRKVKAIVREMTDEQLVVAQGNENLERKNLSFIERAFFAFRLEERGMARSVIMSTFGTSSKGVMSEMIGLARRLPIELVEAIGPAPGVGRPRWEVLADLLADNSQSGWKSVAEAADFKRLPSVDRFETIVTALKRRRPRTTKENPLWAPQDNSVKVVTKSAGKTLSLVFGADDGKPFGEWISKNLDGLYEAFRQSKQET